MEKTNNILTDQISEKLQRPLLAQKEAYTKAKRIYFVEGIIIFNAILGTILIPLKIDCKEISTLIPLNADCKEILAVISVFSAFGLILITSLLGTQTKKGALLQEYFDVELFKIGWNDTLVGKKPNINDLIPNAKKRDEPVKDWYSNKIHKNIPHNFAVILCIKSNTSFTIYLREKYTTILIVFLSSYYLISILLAFLFNTGFYNFAIYIAPSIPFLNLMMGKIRNHSDVLKKYKVIDEKLHFHIDNFTEKKIEPDDLHLRNIQDLSYLIRLIPTKIPNWYYKCKSKEANLITDERIEALIKEFKIT